MTIEIPTLECKRCRHEWHPRAGKRPEACPHCRSRMWDKAKRAVEESVSEPAVEPEPEAQQQ